ncbi:MAG: M67 family metallopeptidase [Leptospirillia bacterium]
MGEAEEILLPPVVLREILDHCRSLRPEEACGLVASDASGRPVAVIPVTNSLHSPVRYQMEMREQFAAMKRIRQEGWSLFAIFHSHPLSDPIPSPTDIRQAFYPEAYMIIVGLEREPAVVRGYVVRDGQFFERPLRTEPVTPSGSATP